MPKLSKVSKDPVKIYHSEEMVDVVNENNHVVGTASKVDAHKKGLLHKTVIGRVIDSKGRWLFVKQSDSRQDPGQYACPIGGHVTSGEDDIEALIREAEEESGLRDFKAVLKGKFIYHRQVLARDENHFFIIYEAVTDIVPTLSDESVGFDYFTEEELKKALKKTPELFADPVHNIIQRFYQHLLA